MTTKKEYQARRDKLASRLPANCIAIIPAADEVGRNGDSHYPFRQDSDFYYLTGFNEPEALLVITSGKKSESILFNRPRDPLQEQWAGRRLGQDNASEILGVGFAYPIANVDIYLRELLADKYAVYYPLSRFPLWEERIKATWKVVKSQVRQGIKAPEAFFDLAPLLSEMRLFKSEKEIELMRRAAEISVNAHKRAMQSVKQSHYEYQLEAELLYAFYHQGCRSVAYNSIVASGHNACILHYTENNHPLKKGDLVLIDAGGEYENYAADITRTFPINGVFSKEQRAIYELVLQAQKAGIACIRPGCAFNEIQRAIVKVLTEGLIDLGILKGTLDSLLEREAYKPFYMHNSGHWLGLDVHDCGQYKIEGKWRLLEPGMVLTVEPGLYLSHDLKGVDSRWLGIGVRIEDDVQVTRDGYDILSNNLPVEIDEIEALISG
jgi:Xaa-Pro aminopeptidase